MASKNIPGYNRIRRGDSNPRAAYRAKTRKTSGRKVGKGDGYSSNRGDFRDRFVVELDYGDVNRKLIDVTKELDKNMNSLMASFSKLIPAEQRNNPILGRGQNWTLSVVQKENSKATVETANFRRLLPSSKLPQNELNALMRDIGTLGVQEIRTGIRNPENRPISPRYDTGRMYNAVDFKVRNTQWGARVEIGWTRKFYKYFGFNEQGTESMGAMNAILSGYRRTVPKAYSLTNRFFKNYSVSGGFSGKYKK